MNRKQRRAANAMRAGAAGDTAGQLFAEALRYQQQHRLDDAARAYKHLLRIDPDHAEASNNLGAVLMAQGKAHEASARFARTLELTPQLFDQFGPICATLVAILPPLGEAMRRANAAWPSRLPLDSLLDDAGLAALAADPLLLTILQSAPVRDVALERALTMLRAALLNEVAAGISADDTTLTLACAVAQQCFVNEYIFATTPGEESQIEQIKSRLHDILPIQLAAIAMYLPLHSLPDSQTLLDRKWPRVVDSVVTRQLREPMLERALRNSIPRLTAIDNDTSLRVRQQYEENPYPRWVHVAANTAPTTIDGYLHEMFPTAAVTPLAKTGAVEALVAGSGTGWHAVGIAKKFHDVKVLAVDLSLSSLAYAKRKTPAALAARIDYAQADILKLGTIDRKFDIIDASGVLHHMADPNEGWRILLKLLRPRGLMHIGLYSELGRQDVVAARAFIAERGYGTSAAEIRRARQDLLASPLRSLARFNDFFSLSECRDMLFHVQESRTSIPAIKNFLAEHGLKFIGFEFDQAALQRLRSLFRDSGWSMEDLDRWHALEMQYPDTFSGMYHFWVQKPAA
jgi:SAM-dependent methyltransferase